MEDQEMRERVIKGLEWCMNEKHDCYREKGCPYEEEGDDIGCKYALHRDALALLKAQEPRKPHYTMLKYIVNGMEVSVNHPECPKCYDSGAVLWDAEIEKGAAYCKRCGQAVKWE